MLPSPLTFIPCLGPCSMGSLDVNYFLNAAEVTRVVGIPRKRSTNESSVAKLIKVDMTTDLPSLACTKASRDSRQKERRKSPGK